MNISRRTIRRVIQEELLKEAMSPTMSMTRDVIIELDRTIQYLERKRGSMEADGRYDASLIDDLKSGYGKLCDYANFRPRIKYVSF